MKTIAVTIDETTLNLLDELAQASLRHRHRSALVRIAVREFAEREQERQSEEHEAAVLQKHRKLVARRVRELISQQASLSV
ncbi:MAG: hypothetical protein FJ147_25380 [Deltaproteobacteria bacterium]|nr:hypothetical protein [Deltaproteobacteria bacterium]